MTLSQRILRFIHPEDEQWRMKFREAMARSHAGADDFCRAQKMSESHAFWRSIEKKEAQKK